MLRYLIDVNLPYYFALWRGEQYVHQNDLNDEWKDSQIWDYARLHDLTIVTKDTDFSNRILLKDPPPRVILIAFGNLKMRPFYQRITGCWPSVCELSDTHKLVTVCVDRIEAIE